MELLLETGNVLGSLVSDAGNGVAVEKQLGQAVGSGAIAVAIGDQRFVLSVAKFDRNFFGYQRSRSTHGYGHIFSSSAGPYEAAVGNLNHVALDDAAHA